MISLDSQPRYVPSWSAAYTRTRRIDGPLLSCWLTRSSLRLCLTLCARFGGHGATCAASLPGLSTACRPSDEVDLAGAVQCLVQKCYVEPNYPYRQSLFEQVRRAGCAAARRRCLRRDYSGWQMSWSFRSRSCRRVGVGDLCTHASCRPSSKRPFAKRWNQPPPLAQLQQLFGR